MRFSKTLPSVDFSFLQVVEVEVDEEEEEEDVLGGTSKSKTVSFSFLFIFFFSSACRQPIMTRPPLPSTFPHTALDFFRKKFYAASEELQ